MTAELERNNGQQLAIAGKVTETSLELPDDLSFEEWQATIETIGRISKGCQWWYGDAINHGEARYGEKYSQAMEETGLDYSTLSNYVYTARQVPPENRRHDLSWSHHRAVQGCDPATQKVLLREAKANDWKAARLEKEAKAAKEGTEVVPEPERVPCPACGGAGTVPPEGEK